MRIVLAAAAALLMGLCFWLAPQPEEATADGVPRTFWIKIVFGLDEKSARWDGRLAIDGGKVLALDEWNLETRDRINPSALSWAIQTGIPDANRVSFAEPMRGLMVKVELLQGIALLDKPAVAPNRRAVSDKPGVSPLLRVETAQGNFEVKLLDLIPGRPVTFLDGRASAEPLGEEQLVAETETDDDFAAIAVDAAGHRHVSWIAHDDDARTDRLLVRDIDDPASIAEPVAVAAEFSTPHLVHDGKSLHAFWCSPGEKNDWDVYAAVRERDGWRSERVTTARGTDFELSASRAQDGSVWLTWQSLRAGNGDVFARRFRAGEWSDEIPIATGAADEWQPSVSATSKDSAWIGYDTYERGNYDVCVRQVKLAGAQAAVGDPVWVGSSEDFEAHANVLAEGADVWVAYDAAGPNWGKDFRNVPTVTEGRYSEPLHASRRIELRLVKDGIVHKPREPLPQILPPSPIEAIDRVPTTKPSRFYEFPQLARDGEGRIWLFYRECRQGYCGHPPKGACWKICATTHARRGWLEPIELPASWGRQDQRVSSAVGPDGRLACAWGSGNRFASVNRKYTVHSGTLPLIAERVAEVAVERTETDEPAAAEPVPEIPWTISRNGEEYHVYFGDLHRHTNISRCSPTIDGCLNDAHRYALNAVGYDFLAITDHVRDVDAFSWWRTQKLADQFYLPGRYVTIFAYERSNGTPNGGHRNVFFLNRGADVNPSDAWYSGRELPPEDTRPDTTLYPWMRALGNTLTAAHTPGYDAKAVRGTWTYNDPQMEPVAEIFQGFRQSYERPGRGVSEQAALWFALKKGYRLGFIASSDHISTHMSYACVWAKEKTREAIFEGLAARRTYAATDRIALDVRIGEAFMGEEMRVDGDAVTISIRALGTVPIQDIEIVRSGEVIATLHPEGATADTEYIDRNPLPGESYYYVRLLQDDGALAWGSPIWVRR